MGTFLISLTGLSFHAGHGVYAAEEHTGNRFEVDAYITIDGSAPVNKLEETVNYVEAFRIIREEMGERKELLETLLQRIAVKFEGSFPQMRRLELHIRKLTPLINNFSGTVGVRYDKEYP